MMQTIGRLMGESIAAKQDFDMFWLLHHSASNTCIRCGRTYAGRTRGWLMRHYRRTGHWQQESPPP